MYTHTYMLIPSVDTCVNTHGIYTPCSYENTRVYSCMHTHAHMCMPSDIHTSTHGVYMGTRPPTDTLTHVYLTLTCNRFAYIAAVLSETYEHTDSLLRPGLKACSFLHFLLLTYTFEISLACTHFLLQAYPLSHAHCHTPTHRPNHFLSSFLFPISFFFIPTHTVILAFLFSLSLSLTHTVCFLLSHKLGYSHFPSTRTHRAGNTLLAAHH